MKPMKPLSDAEVKKTIIQGNEKFGLGSRVFSVFAHDAEESFVLKVITTDTKQRAYGFITQTMNLWNKFDLNKNVRLTVMELKQLKNKKYIFVPVE